MKEVWRKMKMKSAFTGIFSLVFYYFTSHLMLLWEYHERYSVIQTVLLYALPALPGIVSAVLLIRHSLREFFKAWGICFLSAACLFFIWNALRVDLLIYKSLTGFEEFGLGEGLLLTTMSFSYIVSCTIGCIIAAIASYCRQKRTCSLDFGNQPSARSEEE